MPDTAFARRNVEKVLWLPRYALGDLVTRLVPRRRDTWVVGSAYGVHDGARALVEELVARGRADRVTWLARSPREAADARALGVRVLEHGSWAAFRAATRAAVVVLTHGYGDASRFGTGGALVVQLWHGSPLKRMHLDSPAAMRLPVVGDRGPVPRLLASMYRRGGQRIGLLPVSSTTVAPLMASALGADPQRVEVLGEPRADVLFRGTEEDRRRTARARVEAAVGDLGGRRVVLLAPTWRDGAADPVVPTPAEWAEIEQWLADHDAVLLVRPHPLAVGDWSYRSDAVRLLDAAGEPEVMRVLWATDAVVSDYSSVVLDAAVTGVPLVFLAPDLEQYTRRHGLYAPYEETTGGHVERSWAQALERLSATWPGGPAREAALAHTRALADRYHERRDGRAAARVVERVDALLGAAPATAAQGSVGGTAFFESFHGRNVSCNPAAIDRELARVAPHVERVWSVSRDGVEVPAGATAVRVGTPEWRAARDRADLLVLNDWIEDSWRPRRDQFVLQTWHGTPLKRIALGRRDRTPRLFAAVVKQSSRWSAMLAQNDFGARALRRSYAVVRPMWTLGYPRNDVVVTSSGEQTRRELGVATSRVVLYAPTWRDDALEAPDPLDPTALAERLGPDWTVLVRGHARTLGLRAEVAADRVLDVTAHPDVSDLLALADVLVTDYSSVMFDFSATGRPMVFHVADAERYEQEVRGFAWDLAERAPGPLVRTTEEVADAVARADDPDERERWATRYAQWRADFNPFDDGRASERVVARLLALGALPRR
ncbi:CDP-glycerol glycerophosphotransferase family protein [Phycicoccus sonneratiae]|uniref:CDP-glycerol glycerophosphotransferase family protein n=1 Tax=Phycicoccus sonneratiae TaxID=2807628 RepID=A0ABS2CM98_9MICO|nr:CDP-glycerol glycerophosphotransferase family protein [Phycicoccus sonneraticus]MBM6400992.1 CDP-glycerol glycerophosphotransferase family protein [Phycicoccus sonneraticus]